MRKLRSSLLVLTCFGCVAESANPPAPAALPADRAASSPSEQALRVEYRPELGEVIAKAGYVGTFVLLDPASERLIVAEPEPIAGASSLAETRFVPASTFKIPHSLIALETGVADGPEFALAWDGVVHDIEAWNHDHVLRTAYRDSVVWYYQELARRIGTEPMQHFVDAFEYGNRDIGAAIDRFWLDGELRISPREQVEFLRRLHEGQLPVSDANLAIMLDDVMVRERRSDGTLIRAKTGWAQSSEQNLGWFVGSVERGDRGRVYFATLIQAGEPAPDSFRSDRVDLSMALLGQLGWLEQAPL